MYVLIRILSHHFIDILSAIFSCLYSSILSLMSGLGISWSIVSGALLIGSRLSFSKCYSIVCLSMM